MSDASGSLQTLLRPILRRRRGRSSGLGAGLLAIGLTAVGHSAPLPAPRARQDQAGSLRERIARLAMDDDLARAEMESLPLVGEDAALAALDGLADAGPLERRRRAHLARVAGGARSVAPAILALDDRDAGTRAELMAFLARGDLGVESLPARVEALALRALLDPEPRLRGRAVELLAGLDRPESLARLDALLAELEEPLRGAAAALLADRRRAREIVERRVLAEEPRDPEVLAPMLAALGGHLGDRADGTGAAPLLAGMRDPDPRVRRGAEIGLQAFFRRLFAGADAARATAAVRALEELGFDRAEGAILRARAALVLTADPVAATAALDAARELVRSTPAGGDRRARSTRAIGLHLEAAALLAGGSIEEAAAPLAEEASLLDGLLAERVDQLGRSHASEHSAWLHRRAQRELLDIVRALSETDLASGIAADKIGACVEAARRVHALELEAQLTDASSSADPSVASLDPLLEDELSPTALLLQNPRLEAFPAPRALAVRAELGRLLATVAPAEAPGFEPYPGFPPEITDPLADPERLALHRAILDARFDAAARARSEQESRVRREMASDPAAPTDADAHRLQVLHAAWSDLMETTQRAAEGDLRALLDSRSPSLHGLSLARALREEGRTADARALAEAIKADLDRTGDLKRILLIEAEIEMTIGSTWIDAGDPVRAEVELIRSVERLETIEAAIRDRGASARDLGVVRGLRSAALVSLAVNANVKMGNPERALAYFERAFALRQDEFMRVLLACYRARSGRAEEARAILREVGPSPANLYNAACTWALLGEKDLALDSLKRELEENPMSDGAREKQKAWARKDPDLSSLRGDPRFRALVGE